MGYRALLAELGEESSLAAGERVQTKELGEDLSIVFLEDRRGERTLATTLDIILYHESDAWQTLVEEARQIHLGEALLPMMPEFYRVMYPETRRDPALLSVSEEQIIAEVGLSGKVRACARLQSV